MAFSKLIASNNNLERLYKSIVIKTVWQWYRVDRKNNGVKQKAQKQIQVCMCRISIYCRGSTENK